MYITLNSQNEPNNADFKNYFQDTMTIKPNSYICLSSLGLAKDDSDIGLGQIETFSFRVAYGQLDFSKNFSVPAGTYTAETLCDTMNNLIINASPVWTCQFSVENVQNVGIAIVVKWTRADGFRGVEQYFNNFLGQNRREAGLGNSAIVAEQAEIVGGTTDQNKLFLRGTQGNNYNYLVGINAPTFNNANFLVPTNMIGKNTFDLNRDQGEISFTVATPKLESNFYCLQPGVMATSADQSVFVVANLDIINNSDIQIIFKGNVFDLKARKRDQTLTTIFQDQQYNPGTSFHISCEPDPAATSDKNCYAYHVVRKGLTNGQIGWIPFDSVNAIDIVDGTEINMFDTADWQTGGTQARYIVSTMGDCMSGIRMGATVNQADATNRYQLTAVYRTNGGTITKGTSGNMPNGRSINLRRNVAGNNRNQHIQLDTNPIQFPLPSMISMGYRLSNDSTNENVLFGGTTDPIYDLSVGNTWAISVGGWVGTFTASTIEYWDFKLDRNPVGQVTFWKQVAGSVTNWNIWNTDPTGSNPIPAPDTTATLSLATWVITYANTDTLTPTTTPLTQPSNEVAIASVTVGSVGVEITFNDRTTETIIPLQNGNGAQWSAVHNTDTYISIACNGAGNNLFILVTEENDDKYWVTHSKGADPALPVLRRIGASTDVLTDPTNRALRMNGNIFDFRLFQYNELLVGNRDVDFFRTIQNDIAPYSLGIQTGFYSNQWLFNQDIINSDFNGATYDDGFTSYGVMGQPRTWFRVNSCFSKTDSSAEICDNWFAYGDFNFPMTRTLTNTDRTNENIIMGQDAHTEENLLKIHTDTGDNVLVVGEEPSVSLLTESGYTQGNPAVLSTGYINLVEDGPENVVAQMNGDRIDNVNIEEQEHVLNVEITNLSHRTFNGRSHNISKSIYELPLNNAEVRKVGDTDLLGFVPPQKIWHSLNNPGEIPLNQLEVKISDEALRTTTTLKGPTSVAIEIKTRDEIF